MDVRISRNPECPTEAEFQKKSMDEFRKGVIMRQALIDRNKAIRKHVPTEDMPSDTPSEEEEACNPGDRFVCMLERCLEICRRKILIKQMHKASIAVEDAELTRERHERAIEMFSTIDVTANDLRYEASDCLKQVQKEAREETRKLWWKREAAAEEEEHNIRKTRQPAEVD